MPPTAGAILCVSSYFKGVRFIRHCREEGAHVVLLTVEAQKDRPWPRDAIDQFYWLPSLADRGAVLEGITHLMGTRPIEVFVALDDFDVEYVAGLREHFRVPGMGESTARFFRDKLAMRMKAVEAGIAVPEFTDLPSFAKVDQFLARTTGPWLVKPRSQASSIGIQRVEEADAALAAVRALGDARSHHLLERMVPGELYHVDSLVSQGEVVFALASKYDRPLLEVYQGGGIFASRTLADADPDTVDLLRLNRKLLGAFGLERGSSHSEYMRSPDGRWYFIETSARVGGAGVADMVEAATGLNPWAGWASVELRPRTLHRPDVTRGEFGGVIMSLARDEAPDTSAFDDTEIFLRIREPHHIGFVLRSPSPERIGGLLANYRERILREHHASLPPATSATH
jgi:biotin carboxylase